jgi:hypothetical protein
VAPVKRHERPLLTADFGAYVRVDENDADLMGVAELFRALRFLDDVGRRLSNGHFWVEECPFRAACVHPALMLQNDGEALEVRGLTPKVEGQP